MDIKKLEAYHQGTPSIDQLCYATKSTLQDQAKGATAEHAVKSDAEVPAERDIELRIQLPEATSPEINHTELKEMMLAARARAEKQKDKSAKEAWIKWDRAMGISR